MNRRIWEIDAGPVTAGSGYTAYVAVDTESREIFESSVVTTASPQVAVAELLARIIRRWGVPETVLTDNSPAFTSRPVEEVFARLGIRHHGRHPFQGQGGLAAERAGRASRAALPDETGV